MNRISVLELIKGLDVGGAEKLLVERLRVTDLERFDVSVGFLYATSNELVAEIESLGVTVHCLGARRRISVVWLWRLRRLIRTLGVAVVHVHSPLMAAGVRLVLKTMGASAPAMVFTEHSVNYHPATQWLNALTVVHDDLVIAVSDAVAEGPVVHRAQAAIRLHYGTDLDRARELRSHRSALRPSFGLPAGPLVVTVANYRAEKDLGTLLCAAREVHSRLPAVQFALAGAGPELPALEALVRELDMESYVHLLGRVENAVRLTARADVFALSSVREGLPVAVMEALACGVPVVATDVGGLSDLVDDGVNGFLVPARDVNALAGVLVKLLSDNDLLHALGAGALESSERFDLRASTRLIEETYGRLASEAER